MRRLSDTVRDGLTRVWDTGGREFVTFEMVRDGRADADRWAQWIDGQMNLRWPRDDDPRTALPTLGAPLPPGAFVSFHAPGENAIVDAWDTPPDEAADFLARYFTRVLGDGGRCEVEVRIDRA